MYVHAMLHFPTPRKWVLTWMSRRIRPCLSNTCTHTYTGKYRYSWRVMSQYKPSGFPPTTLTRVNRQTGNRQTDIYRHTAKWMDGVHLYRDMSVQTQLKPNTALELCSTVCRAVHSVSFNINFNLICNFSGF